MKETYYFPHDNNASQDNKILGLLKDHGLEGLGIYWIMVELLHQQPNGMMSVDAFDSTIQMYVASFGKDKERSFNVRSTFVQRHLFKMINGAITSDRVLRNKEHREQLSNAGKVGGNASAHKRLLNKERSLNDRSTTVQRHSEKPFKHKKERKGKENNTISHSAAPSAGTPIGDPAVTKDLGPKAPNSPKRSKYHQAIDLFLEKYKSVRGADYIMTNWAKQTKNIKPIVESMNPTQFKESIDKFFESDIGFKKHYSLDFFIASINNWRPSQVDEI